MSSINKLRNELVKTNLIREFGKTGSTRTSVFKEVREGSLPSY